MKHLLIACCLISLVACGGFDEDDARRLLAETAPCDGESLRLLTEGGGLAQVHDPLLHQNLTLHILTAEFQTSFHDDLAWFRFNLADPGLWLQGFAYQPDNSSLQHCESGSLVTAERISAVTFSQCTDTAVSGEATVTGPPAFDKRPLYQGRIRFTAALTNDVWRLTSVQTDPDLRLDRGADGSWVPVLVPQHLPAALCQDSTITPFFTGRLDVASRLPTLSLILSGNRNLDDLASRNIALWRWQIAQIVPENPKEPSEEESGGSPPPVPLRDPPKDEPVRHRMVWGERHGITQDYATPDDGRLDGFAKDADLVRRTLATAGVGLQVGIAADTLSACGVLGDLLARLQAPPERLCLLCRGIGADNSVTGGNVILTVKPYDPADPRPFRPIILQGDLPDVFTGPAIQSFLKTTAGKGQELRYTVRGPGDLAPLLANPAWYHDDRQREAIRATRQTVANYFSLQLPQPATGQRLVLCVSPEIPYGLLCSVIDALAGLTPDPQDIELFLPTAATTAGGWGGVAVRLLPCKTEADIRQLTVVTAE